MEKESNNKLAFLDTAVTREHDGSLTTNVYRKPTHTDQYLAYNSHLQSVKRGISKCLYERAKCLLTKSSIISKEKHLSSVLVSNSYPSSFAQRVKKIKTLTILRVNVPSPPPPPRSKRKGVYVYGNLTLIVFYDVIFFLARKFQLTFYGLNPLLSILL